MARLRILLPLVLAVVAIGCGGGDQEEPDRAATPTATASPTVGPAADDKSAAESAALKLEDFPTGWTATENAENLESRCKDVEAAKTLTTARSNSPRFNRGQTTLVQNAIYVFEDAATAEEAFDLVSGEDTQSCYSEAVTGAFAGVAGVESGEPQIAPLQTAPAGDEHAGARVTLPITADGLDVDVTIDLVFVRAGRGLSLNLFVNALAPFDPALRDKLVAATVGRLAAIPR
jgi:hypothetical protein